MKLSIVLLIIIALIIVREAVSDRYVRGCYYTTESQYRDDVAKFLPEDYILGLCTHIIYAFGTTDTRGNSLPTKWNDEDTDWSDGTYSRMMKHKLMDHELKILLSYGGLKFGSENFTEIANDSKKRDHFVRSAIKYLRFHNFDGLDLSWIYPEGVPHLHASLVKAIKAGFEAEVKTTGQQRLLLSAAVAAKKEIIDTGYDVKQIAHDLDLIFLISYDLTGPWDKNVDLHAKLNPSSGETVGMGAYNTKYAAEYWVQKGAPKEKLIIGIPAYGQGWTLADASQTSIGASSTGKSSPSKTNPGGGTAAYWEICDHLKSGGAETIDRNAVGAYMVKEDDWYSYDTPETVATKIQWIKSEGFGGAFIWALDFDDFKNHSCGKGEYPIMNAINHAFLDDAQSRVIDKAIFG